MLLNFLWKQNKPWKLLAHVFNVIYLYGSYNATDPLLQKLNGYIDGDCVSNDSTINGTCSYINPIAEGEKDAETALFKEKVDKF